LQELVRTASRRRFQLARQLGMDDQVERQSCSARQAVMTSGLTALMSA
jgi:hypothetical protein